MVKSEVHMPVTARRRYTEEFKMGAEDEQQDARPTHRVYLSSYWFDVYPDISYPGPTGTGTWFFPCVERRGME